MAGGAVGAVEVAVAASSAILRVDEVTGKNIFRVSKVHGAEVLLDLECLFPSKL